MSETVSSEKPKVVIGRGPISDESITVRRFVVFLDIMGFKDRVQRNEHGAVLGDLRRFQEMVRRNVARHRAANIQSTQFSDSILLFSQDDKEESLAAVSDVASNIMRGAILQGIPLKGALAKGMVTCDVLSQLFFGQALIDAYLLQEDVKYYGILAHHTAETDVRQLEQYYRDVQAPLRGGLIGHYELGWYDKGDGGLDGVMESLKGYRTSVSDEPRRYIDNTLAVIKSNYIR